MERFSCVIYFFSCFKKSWILKLSQPGTMKDFWAVKQRQQSNKHSMSIRISLEFLAGCLHCYFVTFFLLTALKINTNQKVRPPLTTPSCWTPSPNFQILIVLLFLFSYCSSCHTYYLIIKQFVSFLQAFSPVIVNYYYMPNK